MIVLRKIIAVTLLVAVSTACSSTGSSDDDDPDTMPAKQGWTLVWNDEFDGPGIDGDVWNYWVTGNPYNNELQYYTNRAENSFIEDGRLVIEALEETYTGPDGTRQYTSARINTRGNADFRYGRFEIRARLPFGQGIWPAIWLMPTESIYGGWPASGEIDIMELVGHEPGTVHGTIHYTDPDDGRHLYRGGGYSLQTGAFVEDFHVFAFEWEEDEMRWYVDDRLFLTKTEWSTRFAPYPAPFDQEFYIILNLAIGGNWPGSPDGTTIFPQRMEVDYVRVFQRTGE